MEKEEQASTGKRKIKLNYPVCSYLDEIIYRGFSFIDGNKPIENIIDMYCLE